MDKRENKIIKEVVSVLIKLLNPSKIIIFGSRAKKNNRKHSDFDFAVDAPKPALSTERKIKEEIDKVSGLYKVDVVYFDSVDEKFKEIILKTGRIVYEQSKR